MNILLISILSILGFIAQVARTPQLTPQQMIDNMIAYRYTFQVDDWIYRFQRKCQWRAELVARLERNILWRAQREAAAAARLN